MTDRRTRLWLAFAALNGLIAVATGAFGAHATHDPEVRDWLRTGAQYQLVHAAAAVGVLGLGRSLRGSTAGAALFAVGGLIFAGSLDLLALTRVGVWGAVTPIGGLAMIAGWLVLGVGAIRSARSD